VSVVDLSRYARDPVAFIDRFIRFNELGQPFCLLPHQRDILSAAFQFDADGRLAYDTIIFSTVKKSGKTTINAAITLWWAFTQEAPNELNAVANDLEQSTARVFATVKGLLRYNDELGHSADVKAQAIVFSNGTVFRSLANDYAGEAGGNQGYSSFTEIWASISESSRRLWEELTPVPTRRNSIRFIDTYAGFEGESDLLFSLYKLGVGPDEHPDGQGERLHPTLPIYANRAARLFCYWDHEPRMPWQTSGYYAAQRRTLRPSTYLRLHENRWTTGVSTFLRWVTVPAFMLNLFTKKNVPLSSWGTGMQFFRRKGNFDLVGSLTYQNLSPSPGNWLGKGQGHPANLDTDYVVFDHLEQWGGDVSFIWHSMFTEWFGMHYGAGIGIAYIQGTIWRTSNGLARDANGNPTPGPGACTEENAGDVNQCYPVGSTPNGSGGRNLSIQSLVPGNDQAGNPHRFPDTNKPPVLPIVNIVVGFDFRLPQVRGWEGRIEGGFYNAFFLGGAVGYTF
jgi:hypothetical protein